MAVLHRAELRPSKLDLLASWVPTRAWADGSGELQLVGSYRFDDPAGAVGIETHLVRRGDGPVLQVPLTYRDAPLEGADSGLVSTMEHSVLGTRWVYDGCADPIYARALATAIRTGGRQADQVVDLGDGRFETREPTAQVIGSGARAEPDAAFDAVVCTDADDVTMITGGEVVLGLIRRPGRGRIVAGGESLAGTWTGQDESVLLAFEQ